MTRHPAGTKLIKENLMFEPVKYVRKPFYVQAAQVTEENITQVARWCEGTILIDERPYIKVKVKRPLAERQTRAFVGDWVLSSGNGYKVYTQASFEKNFEDFNENLTLTNATNEKLEQFLEKLDEKLKSY
jgi:hypothetical protein